MAAPTAASVPQVPIARDPGVRANPGAFGVDTAQAVQQAGQAIGEVAGALSSVSDVLAAKKRRAAVAASTASAANDLQNFTLDLERDPDYETYSERFQARSNEVRKQWSAGLDADGQEEFERRYRLMEIEASGRVRRLNTARTVDAGVADLNTALAGYAHMAGQADSPEEFDLAQAMAREDVERAVVDGFITETTGTRALESFMAQADEVAARQLIEKNPAAAIEALKDGEIFPSLNEELRIALRSAAAQDIERQKTAREVEAGRLVTDAAYVLGRGRVPDNLEDVQRAAQGTRYAARLDAAIRTRQAVQEFMTLPLTDQARRLRGVDVDAPASREDVERTEAQARAYNALATQVSQGDGLAASALAGVTLDPLPIDWGNPNTLAARAQQAHAASLWAGQPVSPLLDAEADALALALDSAPPSEVTGLLRNLTGGLGESSAGALAAQVAPKRPELAAAISIAPHRPLIARDIVVGGRAARTNPDVVPGKDDRTASATAVYGNLFTAESAPALAAYQDAAAALYAGRRVASGDLSFDADLYEEALHDVAGGPVEWNGRTILPPLPGMAQDDVTDLLDGLTDEDLTRYGNGAPIFADGSAFRADQFSRGMFAESAQLVSAGPGRYLVFMPGLGYVQQPGGAYVLNLRAKVQP